MSDQDGEAYDDLADVARVAEIAAGKGELERVEAAAKELLGEARRERSQRTVADGGESQ